jgi:hypothetical protein
VYLMFILLLLERIYWLLFILLLNGV